MRVLVTGADGFVGRHLVRRLVEAEHEVVAACGPGGHAVDAWREAPFRGTVHRVPLEITDDAYIRATLDPSIEAVIHLAAVASNRDARQDPGRAWSVNAAGTARLMEAVAELRAAGTADPLVLLVSTGEVYGAQAPVPRRETDPLLPRSPYAASKAGAEVAALEAWRRAGVRAVIARPFTHTGLGQLPHFVLPAFVTRLREARASGVAEVPVGNLDPVRDLLDVRDVVEGYVALLMHGAPGEAYNVSRGEGVTLRELFYRLADLVGARVEPRPDPALMRAIDIPSLVGDSTKLRRATGWAPTITVDDMLRGLVDAEAD